MLDEQLSQGQPDIGDIAESNPPADAGVQPDGQDGTATGGQQPSDSTDDNLESLRQRADTLSKSYREAEKKIHQQGRETSTLRQELSSRDRKIAEMEQRLNQMQASFNGDDVVTVPNSGGVNQDVYNQAVLEMVDMFGQLRSDIDALKSGTTRGTKQRQYMDKFGVSETDANRAIELMSSGDDVAALELLNAASVQSKLQQQSKRRQSQARQVADSLTAQPSSAPSTASSTFDYDMEGKSPAERAAALASAPEGVFDELVKRLKR